MRKHISLLLVLTLVCAFMLSMGASAFAAQSDTSYQIGGSDQTWSGSGWRGSTAVNSVTIDGVAVDFTASGTKATVSASVLDELTPGAHTVNLHQDHYTDGEIDDSKDTTFTLTVIGVSAPVDEPADEPGETPPEPPAGEPGENPPEPPAGEPGENPPEPPAGEQGENPPEPPAGEQGENPPEPPAGEDPGAAAPSQPSSSGGNASTKPSSGGSAPSKPDGSGGAEPKTGDNANIGVWVAVIVLCGAAAVVVMPKAKRN